MAPEPGGRTPTRRSCCGPPKRPVRCNRLSTALVPWRKPLAPHNPRKVLLDLAVAVAVSGDCLADTDQVRADTAVFGQAASDPTVSRLISALAADARGLVSDHHRPRAGVDGRRHRSPQP